MALRKRQIPFLVAFLALAVAVSVLLVLLFWPSEKRITLNDESWAMPGGGPSHTSYLPLAPKGPLKEKWSTRLEALPSGPAAVAGGRVFVCCENGFLYSLDLETGKPIWLYDAKSGISSMPAVYERGVLLGTIDGKVLEVGPSGSLNWEVEVGGAVLSTPIPVGDRIYFGSSDGHLYCVSSRDGSRKWDFDAGSAVEFSPCLLEGQVFGVSFQGDLFALDAASGKLNWTFRSKGIPVAMPSADSGKVFLATEFVVFCCDAQSGKVMWQYSPSPNLISNAAVRGSQLLAARGLAGEGCEALSLDARTGDLLWKARCGESPERSVAIASNENLYLMAVGHLRALSAEAGTPTLDLEVREALAGTFCMTGRYVLVATGNRKLYCFED